MGQQVWRGERRGSGVTRSNGEGYRPNRREFIIDHAIGVFARQGFQGSSIQDVATATSLAPTAIYYHFSSKELLYDAALAKVFTQIDEVVDRSRPVGHGDESVLVKVLGAVWDWVERNPEPAQLLYHQLPGATPEALKLRSDFEERHIQRAVDYLPTPPEAASKKEAAARWAVLSLATRTTVSLGMTIHSMRMAEGPLASHSAKALRTAYLETSGRIIQAAAERILTGAHR
jgi:AcrR family transcriptional regulator